MSTLLVWRAPTFGCPRLSLSPEMQPVNHPTPQTPLPPPDDRATRSYPAAQSAYPEIAIAAAAETEGESARATQARRTAPTAGRAFLSVPMRSDRGSRS